MDPIVVVGAGLAGATAVTELRKSGHDGPIVLFGAEPHLPYERPPLSKSYLMGQTSVTKALVHDAAWYAQNSVDLRQGTTVTGINLTDQTVTAADGDQRYDRLLIATGSKPRRLAMADESGAPVAYLRTIEDSDRIRESFGPDKSMVIIGAGWIGLEVAAAARAAGTTVTIFEVADLPLERVLGPKIAQVFADLHRQHGVDLRLGTKVTADDLQGADLVVVGVGVEPEIELAQAAGLDVDNGILVDDHLRTSDARVWAVGDVANAQHPILGRRIRVEHWDTAIQHGKVAARNMAGGDEAHTRLPYFFTDQYDLGLEYVGRGAPEATVHVDGDPAKLKFKAWWVEDGTITAGMHVNDWDAIDEIRKRVGQPWTT